MAVVYKAEDTRLRRPVALKFLPEHLAEDHAALERFQREARAASALNHPNICSIFDLGEYEGHPFLAMEFLDGETLKQRISRGPMPFEEILEVSLQVVEGSQFQMISDGWVAFDGGRYDEAERIWQGLPEGALQRRYLSACGPEAAPEERTQFVDGLRASSAAFDPERHYNTARFLTFCGEHGLALQFLSLAIEKNYCGVSAFEAESPYAPLREHPSFTSVYERALTCRERFLEHRARYGEREGP